MPENWQTGQQAVLAYKHPKLHQSHMLMRVRELPNSYLEVQMEGVPSDPDDPKLESLIKMIDKHGQYTNLDAWLAQTEFVA